MKAVLYFPLAYVADVHGFLLLAPYLVIFLTIARTAQVYSRTRVSRPAQQLSDRPLAVAAIAVR